MTPSHCNKAGVRYRYYVSHALLQRQKDEAGRIARVPAIQVEALVVEAVRYNLQQTASTESYGDLSDREVIGRYVERVVVSPQSIDVQFLVTNPVEATEGNTSAAAFQAHHEREQTVAAPAGVITVPWDAPTSISVKGILHQPCGNRMLKPEARDAILLAIAKARSWIDDLASGRFRSFDEIAQREGKVERHVRLLAPLAFTPPELLASIIAASAPNDDGARSKNAVFLGVEVYTNND